MNQGLVRLEKPLEEEFETVGIMEKHYMKVRFGGINGGNGSIENFVSFSFYMFMQERCQCMNTVNRDCSIFDVDDFGVLGTFEKFDFMDFF
jgi:hypothetical protein